MELTVDLAAGIPVVRISGDMRLWGKQALADQIRETMHSIMDPGPKRVVLNLAGATRIDSRGIGCLARCHATAITKNVEIVLVVAPGFVLDTLKQLNFVRLYPTYDSEAAAIAAAASASQ